MEPMRWIPPETGALLDVGCNTGDLLADCRRLYPRMRLAGIDVNHSAIEAARRKVPDAELHQGFGYRLPFADAQFPCVTCIEVIEHVPAQHRVLLIEEVRRVLDAGGRFVLRCPHAGWFHWLDAQNFRFQFPRLYKTLVGEGNRDPHYCASGEEIVPHYHFRREELLALAGSGWEVEACVYGGLVLFPITDILRWPFYRRNRADHWIARALQKVAAFEMELNFGRGSYGILLVLRKV
jgi:SAM-dependent methyltransferase